jgi:alpha-galactosidase
MTKIAFIVRAALASPAVRCDIHTFPAPDATLTLMDVDPERLEFAQKSCQRIVDMGNYPATVKRPWIAEALEGADGVLCTILQGGVSVFRHDIEIPKKYGVDINIGDTRALWHLPLLEDRAGDAEHRARHGASLSRCNDA